MSDTQKVNINYIRCCAIFVDGAESVDDIKTGMAIETDMYLLMESFGSVTSTTKTTAFVEPGSTQIAISAEIDGKETYLSELKKGENTWWTKVTCNKQDSGYSLSWKTLPIAEDYALVSSYSVTYVMNEYASGKSELKLKELTDYEHEAASSNPYNAVYNYRKCR